MAPVVPLAGGMAPLLAPRLTIGGAEFQAVMLGMTPVRTSLLGPAVEASLDEDDILRALDVIVRGYPVGLPIA